MDWSEIEIENEVVERLFDNDDVWDTSTKNSSLEGKKVAVIKGRNESQTFIPSSMTRTPYSNEQ